MSYDVEIRSMQIAAIVICAMIGIALVAYGASADARLKREQPQIQSK